MQHHRFPEMTIHPRHYTDFDRYADAVVHAAIAGLPSPDRYDDHDTYVAKRQAIYAAMAEAEAEARDEWEAHVDHMEDLYERGVGPAWD